MPRISDRAMFVRLVLPGFLISLGAGQVIPYLNVFVQVKFGLDLASLNAVFALTSLGTTVAILFQPALARRIGQDRLGRARPGREHPVPRRAGVQPHPVERDRGDGDPQLAHERRQPDLQRVRDGAAPTG